MISKLLHSIPVLALILCSGSTASFFAQDLDPADFETVLVPVFYNGEGALGSMWESRAVVYNDGDEVVHFARGVLNGDSACDAICGCGVRSEIGPDETNQICQGFASPAGVLLYPRRDEADSLYYELIVKDRARNARSAGTEVPVVREGDLREKVVLLDVPAGERFRTALRVLDSHGRDGVQVRMQVFGTGETEPLLDSILTLAQLVQYFAPEPFPANPSIAFIPDLDDIIVPPDDGPSDLGPRLFRIELTPIAPLERFWAFVSITNDETNEVTTITP